MKRATSEDNGGDTKRRRSEIEIPDQAHDIELAARTLSFISSDNVEEALSHDQVRTVVANLVDFQQRFAAPMELPFQLGKDHLEFLEIPRQLELLLKYNIVAPTNLNGLDPSDGFVLDGKWYALVGGKIWKGLVESNAVTGELATQPNTTAFEWIKDLFKLFRATKAMRPEVRSKARELAACWYYICTQFDFNDTDETGDVDEFAANLVEGFSEMFGLNNADESEGESNEGSIENDQNLENKEGGDDGKDGDDDDDEDGDDDDDEFRAKEEGDAEQNEVANSAEIADEDDSDEAEEDEGVEQANELEEQRPVSPAETSLRDEVCSVVEELGAYMPDPTKDVVWFKRMLKQVKLAQQLGDNTWFPWGCPPIERIAAQLTGEDSDAKLTAERIMNLFQINAVAQSKLAIARCADSVPALAAIALSTLARTERTAWQASKNLKTAELRFTSGDVLTGDLTAAKYFARVGANIGLYGWDPLSASLVDGWIDFALADLRVDDDAKFGVALDTLNAHLRLRTLLVGHDVSLADIIVWSTLALSSLWSGVVTSNKKIKYKNLIRWWTYIESLDAVIEARKYLQTEVKEEGPHVHGTFGDLPNGEYGKVVVRFPPEPSGYLHVGHAKAAFLNQLYAEKYGGKMIVRFDDTNPRKEKEEFEEAILQDLQTMGIKPDFISHTSDYFDKILEKAEELIRVGKAYCDDSSGDQMEDLRSKLLPSPHRDDSVEQTLKIWNELKNGTEVGKRFALRAKIDYQSKNGTMRDPVIYRYVDIPHNRTGDRFKIYPIYNFSCPIVDSVEGVTHALRSNEYHDSEEQYFWNVPGLRDVRIKDFGRVNFSYTVLSKRKLQWFVDEGIVPGWDDPRFPTVQGITRRGLTMEALRQFIFDQGDSKKPVNLDINRLWAFNKKVIDRSIPRYTAVKKENIVVLSLTDGPTTPEKVEVLCHKQNESLGKKTIVRTNKVFIEQEDAQLLAKDLEVTLMDWGNVIVTSVEKESSGKVTGVTAKMNLAGDVKKTANKLTWLPADPSSLVDVELVEYDSLITEKTIPKDKEFKHFVNRESKQQTIAYADPNVKSLPKSAKIQFERIGYFIVDTPATSGPMSLILIPDGHTKNVFLAKKVAAKQ